MVNPEVITFCLSWGLMEQKLKLFRLETIPEVAVRVKYNSFAACLLRLLLTSSGPAAGQQLRRRRKCPRPRAPRKGSRGSGRRFRDEWSRSHSPAPPGRERRRWAGQWSRPWPHRGPEGDVRWAGGALRAGLGPKLPPAPSCRKKPHVRGHRRTVPVGG